jgi:hypothetical protein
VEFLSVAKPWLTSFMWWSILFGRDIYVVKRNQVGVNNGDGISIMKDPWTPGYPVGSFKPLSPIPRSTKVHSMMSGEVTS